MNDPLNTDTPVNTDTFYRPLSVRISGINVPYSLCGLYVKMKKQQQPDSNNYTQKKDVDKNEYTMYRFASLILRVL